MKLQLLDAIGEITEARTAAGLWQQGQGCSLTGLSGAAKTVFLRVLRGGRRNDGGHYLRALTVLQRGKAMRTLAERTSW